MHFFNIQNPLKQILIFFLLKRTYIYTNQILQLFIFHSNLISLRIGSIHSANSSNIRFILFDHFINRVYFLMSLLYVFLYITDIYVGSRYFFKIRNAVNRIKTIFYQFFSTRNFPRTKCLSKERRKTPASE